MRNLIIVCEEKCRGYGDYLSQLISSEDDTEDTIVGTKDGEVAVQVWGEKDFKANQVQLSSNQYILFIGHSKLIKEKSSHMNIVFSEFGMKYGWLGKQAVLGVEKTVGRNEYDSFWNLATKYLADFESKKLIEEKNKNKKPNKSVIAAAAVATPLAARIIVPLVAPLATPIAASAAAVVAAKNITLNKKIEEQQYSCAVMKFYLDDLSKFLGL